jgi:cell division transport system permease protein
MDLMTTFSRAKRGLRDDLRVHLVAVASLAIAFLCLGASLLAITNLSHMSKRWGESRNVSVYIKDNAKDADVAQLRMLLESVDDIASSTLTSSEQARKQFAANADLGISVDSLPPEAFPASLELTLKPGTTTERVAQLAQRVGRFAAVDAVETYQTWFGQLTALVSAGRTASLALALLVIICVVAVVGNTIRLAVAGRRQEIEVLKLCGATDAFVRGPFVVEGAAQSTSAALLAVILLSVGYLALHARIDATLSSLVGVSTVFINPLWLVAMVIGGGLIGALGSMLSVRRYLSV